MEIYEKQKNKVLLIEQIRSFSSTKLLNDKGIRKKKKRKKEMSLE